MSKKFLDKAYGLTSVDQTIEHYDDWAGSYEDEVGAHGYATPGRIAAALWQHLPAAEAPVLDYGCGTGLCGEALAKAGFAVIDGMDPSENMRAEARDKGVYRNLIALDVEDASPIPTGAYRAIACCGVLGTGAAPAETMDLIMRALETGGFLVFSYNDHTLADAAYTSKLNEWLDCGAARLLFKEYGPHLPGAGLKADVYVIEKA